MLNEFPGCCRPQEAILWQGITLGTESAIALMTSRAIAYHHFDLENDRSPTKQQLPRPKPDVFHGS